MVLYLTVLGEHSVRIGRGATAISFPTQKAAALFAYIALQQRRVPREEVAKLLWANVPDEQALHSLRQALFEIRKTIGPAASRTLRSDRWFLAVDRRGIRVDVHRFERLAARRTRRALALACTLYGGDLLAGLHTREPFDAWLAAERLRLKETAIDAHEQHLRLSLEAGAIEEAIRTAQALIVLSPFDEWAHRTLATLYAQRGEVRRASNHLYACLDLFREIGRPSEAGTRDLLEELIRRGEMGAAPSSTPYVAPRPAANDSNKRDGPSSTG